jgi:hypothetical protein
MFKNLARLDAFRRKLGHDPEKWGPVFGKDHAPTIAPVRTPAHSNDNRPTRRLASAAPRRLVCRWRVDAGTGRPECRWLIESVDEPAAEVPIRRSAWRLPAGAAA